MTWEEKFQAIQSLGSAALRMRSPGNWYVDQGCVEVKVGSILEGRYGNGSTPQRAVEDHWLQLTLLKPDERVVIRAFADRREVRWNGFMWKDY